jgi:Cdc6-like AAA superfamily ATPase
MNRELWIDHLRSWKAFLNERISLTEDEGERIKCERQIKTIERVRCGAVLNPSLLSEFISPSTDESEETVCEKFYFDLNDSQKKAVRLALGENVLSLIQGPPGTGKTTVIRAICERFREIYEAEEQERQKINPEHILHTPKILISSFQNDAVDNAIAAPLQWELPAYRKVARRTKSRSRKQYEDALDKWYNNLKQTLTEKIEDTVPFGYVLEKRKNQYGVGDYRTKKDSPLYFDEIY